ncbi:hypothetical protein K431DRAFT_193483, partial [Polychaeton citri CBS 116435]
LLDDWQKDLLTVTDLLDTNLRSGSPFFAYLSACGTNVSGAKSSNLVNTMIHLVSPSRLAGFRHVIGTLWKVDAESCVAVAETTYMVIGDEGLGDVSVSLGLHEASRKLPNDWFENSLGV